MNTLAYRAFGVLLLPFAVAASLLCAIARQPAPGVFVVLAWAMIRGEKIE